MTLLRVDVPIYDFSNYEPILLSLCFLAELCYTYEFYTSPSIHTLYKYVFQHHHLVDRYMVFLV